MTTYSKAKANLLWARVLLAKEEGFGPGQGFRYDIADFVQEAWPEKGVPALIPVSVEARKHQEAGIKTRYEHSVPLKPLRRLAQPASSGWQLKCSSLRFCRRASISSISAFLPMKALSAASLFRAAFSARSWWRGVVIGFRRVIVAAPW